MSSCPAANGIRCVKPSRATVSPSCTSPAIASERGTISATSARTLGVAARRRRRPGPLLEAPQVRLQLLHPRIERVLAPGDPRPGVLDLPLGLLELALGF